MACYKLEPDTSSTASVNTRATIHARAIQTDRVRETNHCKTVVAKYLCSLHSAKAFVRQFTSSNYLLT